MKTRMKVALSAAALLALLALAAPKVKAITLSYVQVLNTLSQWVPTGSVFEPGRNPWMASNGLSYISDNNEHILYTVPAGKRLVLTHASAICQSAGAFFVYTETGGTVYETLVSPPFYDIFHPFVTYSSQVTAFADPGTQVGVGFNLVAPDQPVQGCTATLAGYLVDLNPPAGLP